MNDENVFRDQVAGLTEMGDIELRGETYTGSYLASMVAVNPQQPVAESARTPELIYQLGRLVAAAAYEADIAEVEYRVWRDGQIVKLTTDPAIAGKADPGLLGDDESPDKTMSVAAAERHTRASSGYKNRSKKKAKAAEVHAVMHAAYEAARARQRAIYNFEAQGGVTATRVTDDNASHEYDDSPRIPLRTKEEVYASNVSARTPIPAPNGAATPPPPPPVAPEV